MNGSFAPCTLQEGLDIWQTGCPLCQGEHALKVSRKTHRSPNLLKFPAFGQAARCKAQVRLWCHPQWMCFCLGGFCSQKENPNSLLILIPSVLLWSVCTSYFLYFIYPEFKKCLENALKHMLGFLESSCAGPGFGCQWSLWVSPNSGYSMTIWLYNSIIVLSSSTWLKRSIFIICSINHSRWATSHFHLSLYICFTGLLIYSCWHSILLCDNF